MPYNTRRKSLSLESLGIHVPVHRASSTNNQSNMSSHARRPSSESSPRPSKKAKRSHSDAPSVTFDLTCKTDFSPFTTPSDPIPPLRLAVHTSIENDDAPAIRPVSLEGINDEIVEAVINQLQQTRNRPHIAKDLVAILLPRLSIVQQSANPCAIVSSRLCSFIKRSSWTAEAPCPLAKELETVHPRRTYFYLSTCPHLPLPDPSSPQSAVVTPSLSSSGSTIEDTEPDRRRELSMSPEVDLSSPEFDGVEEDCPVPVTPVGSIPAQPRRIHPLSRSHKADEPPLERDEKEFTQTADGLQRLKARGGLISATPADKLGIDDGMSHEQLFGEPHRGLVPGYRPHIAYMTSPAMRPTLAIPPPMKRDGEAEGWAKLDAMLDWDKSPEMIELDELDGLLNGF